MTRASRRLFLLVGMLCAARARAAGPESPEMTARVLGRAGAAVASATDLSALDENPAALARLPAQAMASVTAISRDDKALGTKNRAGPSVLGFVAASAPLGARVTIAAGAMQAAETSLQFYQTASSFSRLIFPAGVAIRLPGLLVGVAARAERVDDAWGVSGGAGILVAPNAPVQAAVAVNVPTAGDATTPWTARGGIRLLLQRLDAEVAGSYETWSDLRGFQDSGSIRAGLDIVAVPSWLILRAGWSWEPAAVAPAQLSQSRFDLDHHSIATGVSACTAGLCIDLAFMHVFAATHANGGSGGDVGRYEGHTDAASLSLRVDFAEWRRSASADERSH